MLGPWLTLAAILIVAASAGYTLYRVARPGITDSVWFWLFAFGATGLIGLLAVSPKYDDRQKRLEARYEARSRSPETSDSSRSRSRETSESDSSGNQSRETSASDLQYDYQERLRVPLHFLAAALLIASLTTGYVLIRNASPTSEP